MAKIGNSSPPSPADPLGQRLANWLRFLAETTGATTAQTTPTTGQTFLVQLPESAGRAHTEHSDQGLSEVDGRLPAPGNCVLPGSFAPLHHGHLEMAKLAMSKLPQPAIENPAIGKPAIPKPAFGSGSRHCWFEICIANVDKPPLDLQMILDRIQQDFGGFGVLLSNAPTFEEKSQLFPGVTFAVGADTIRRICKLKYYENNQARFEQAIASIKSNGNRFLVFGRIEDGEFLESEQLDLPASVSELCEFVSSQEFRIDISSSEIRNDQ